MTEADGREGDTLPDDVRTVRQQVRVAAPSQLALPQVDRVLDLNHRSRPEQIDAALAAIGPRLDVVGVAETAPAAAVATARG